jgi:hypothetical protein
MEPGPTATDNARSIGTFRDRGHKLIMWHGWADQIIMPQVRRVGVGMYGAGRWC